MKAETTKLRECEFELNPFISSVACWLDREVLENQPEFKTIELAERIARVCLELHEREVATMTDGERIPVWVPNEFTEKRIGGSRITSNTRFKTFRRDQSRSADQFQLAVRKHAQQRLTPILEYTEALFQLCNQGRIKIIGVASNGSFMWAPKLPAPKRRRSRKGR